MRRADPELASAGAAVRFVGTGQPAMAAAFAAEWAGPHPVLSDPSRAVFAAAGMRRSLFATLHWRLFANAWRAFRSGFRQGKVQGDPWQQGGVLVLDQRGAIVHRQIDRAGGDPLDLGAVLAAVRKVTAHG
ncbi:MAG: AhpC/TSA family protein [Planctomycetes bacterium]|nr:AhpC/TSA family protein [Planctomycetota bacterium]